MKANAFMETPLTYFLVIVPFCFRIVRSKILFVKRKTENLNKTIKNLLLNLFYLIFIYFFFFYK